MELWIRSQDKKTLAVVKNICYVEYDEEHGLIGFTYNESDDFDLGVYKSEERALEVLDEINDRIINRAVIYQMPEE